MCALLGAGIYPGVSNVMAAHMISIARREYKPDWTYTGADAAADSGHMAPTELSGTSGAEALEAIPLRSGVATMEPNEGMSTPL